MITPQPWWIFRNTREPTPDQITTLPPPPSWRTFGQTPTPPPQDDSWHAQDLELLQRRGQHYYLDNSVQIELINAALFLRRPLLVTGDPGTGKSSLAAAIAYELQLGPVLYWPITSRTTIQDGLYRYDAIGRLQAVGDGGAAEPLDIGAYLHLGPLGQALIPRNRPRVLLIDEIDKSDIDFPNDLLTVFEDGAFEIPELSRIKERLPTVSVQTHHGSGHVEITHGRVCCHAFPIIVLTNNGERDFPPAFLRRCIRLDLPPPSGEKLTNIVQAHLGPERYAQAETDIRSMIHDFEQKTETHHIATDQLLNALYIRLSGTVSPELLEAVLEPLARRDA